MEQGVIVRWVLQLGEPVNDMDVTCEVRTAELTDDPADGAKILEIEAHEDGWLAAVLVGEGESAAPDEAIAVICEQRSDIEAFRNYREEHEVQHVEPATFAWQAYLKAGETARGCSNS